MIIEQEEGTPLGRIPDDPHQPVDEDPDLVQSILDELQGGSRDPSPASFPTCDLDACDLPRVDEVETSAMLSPMAPPMSTPMSTPMSFSPSVSAVRVTDLLPAAGAVFLTALVLFTSPVQTLLQGFLSRLPVPGKTMWVPVVAVALSAVVVAAVSLLARLYI